MNDFLTPQGLKILFEAQAENVPPSDFIRKPQHKILKEMWCALRFGLGYEKYVTSCWVKVNMDERSDTDFFLKTKAGTFPFQTTIADVPERRMGEDYKPGQNGTLPARPYAPERGRIEGPEWIANAIREKVDKRYSAALDLNLLVYANFTAHELDYHTVCNQLRGYICKFSSIWIITNHLICSASTIPLLGEIPYFADMYNFEE